MDNVKNDAYYLQKLEANLKFIVKHMRDIDIEKYMSE